MRELKTTSYAPFTLKAYLDKFLEPDILAQAMVAVIDFDHTARPEEMAACLLGRHPDIVGFSVYIWNATNVFQTAQIIKSRRPEVTVLLGGPQVSPVARQVMEQNPFIDAVHAAPAAGEIVLRDYLAAVVRGEDPAMVGGLVFRDARGLVAGPAAVSGPLDYEAAPSPYTEGSGILDEDCRYYAVIEGARGCPHDCGYCFWGGNRTRTQYFALERVLRDIEVVYANPRVTRVFFADADMLSDKRRAAAIVQRILETNRKILTEFDLRFESIDEPLARLLHQLPGFRFSVCLQTATPEALRCISRTRTSPQVYRDKVRQLRQWVPDARLKVEVLLGLPKDNLPGYLNTLDFALSLEPSSVWIGYPVYLLPGSRFFAEQAALGIRSGPAPTHALLETSAFPRSDIHTAIRIGVWLRILTFYYPVIAEVFYRLARRDGDRIGRLQRWSDEIEKDFVLFEAGRDLASMAAGPVNQWDHYRKQWLGSASTNRAGLAIYQGIDRVMGQGDAWAAAKIRHGIRLFSYLCANEEATLETLPESISQGLGHDELRLFLSRYER